MTGISWGGDEGGGIEVWENEIRVTTDGGLSVSEPLTDYSLVLTIFHALGDWLIAHPAETVTPS